MRVSEHCYAVTGLYYFPPWTVNAGFIAGKKTTLIVDAGSNTISAQTVYGYARAVRPENDVILVNTEKHLDHIGGNSYFHERGVEIYGHALIKRRQRDYAAMVAEENSRLADTERRSRNEGLIAFQGTEIVNPDVGIAEAKHFDLGGVTAHVLPTPGHTETNLSVIVASERVIYCRDCVLEGFMPNTDEADVQKWQASLQVLRGYQPEILVPGHGNVITGRESITREIRRIEQELDRFGR